MKKIFVSSIVIIAFVAYSLYQKGNGSPSMPIISPKSSLSQTSSMPTTVPTPISTSAPTPTFQPTVALASPTPTEVPTSTQTSGYKDGTYIGDAADAFYGNIQVQAIIQNGKITNVQFLQYPNDRSTSIYINQQADPMLTQEAIQSQTANVDIVSGATDSSNAFIQSLQSALNKAKA